MIWAPDRGPRSPLRFVKHFCRKGGRLADIRFVVRESWFVIRIDTAFLSDTGGVWEEIIILD